MFHILTTAALLRTKLKIILSAPFLDSRCSFHNTASTALLHLRAAFVIPWPYSNQYLVPLTFAGLDRTVNEAQGFGQAGTKLRPRRLWHASVGSTADKRQGLSLRSTGETGTGVVRRLS